MKTNLLIFILLSSIFTNHCMQDISLKKAALQTVVASMIVLSQMLPVAALGPEFCMVNNAARPLEYIKATTAATLLGLVGLVAFEGKINWKSCLFATLYGILGTILGGVLQKIANAPICGYN